MPDSKEVIYRDGPQMPVPKIVIYRSVDAGMKPTHIEIFCPPLQIFSVVVSV